MSVLIPILNEAGFIEETLPRMLDQQFEGGIEFLFLDGGSDDGTLDILARWAAADERIRILDNPARRQSAALNIGLAEARGEYIVRMDAHTFYPPDYVRTGVERLRRGDVAWAAGPQIAVGVDPTSKRIALALSSTLGIGGARLRVAHSEEFEADTGFTGALRVETLRQLGGWNEDWLTNEDGELAARVQAGGGRIVCVPRMAAEYVPRRSLAGLARQYWRYGLGRAKTWRRHPGSLRPAHLLPPALLVIVAGAAVAPGSARWICRAGVGSYAVALMAESARMSCRVGARDAAWLPLIFTAMHVPWGAGFLAGAIRPSRSAAAEAR